MCKFIRSDKVDKIKIIVDTASDISMEEAKENNIELVPVNITIKGKTYRELFDISKEEYWKILEESDEIPTTSQISPETFLNTYKKLCNEGYNKIIVVTINSKGSGTFNSANLAYNIFKEDNKASEVEFKFIDSGIYTYCYGKPVIDAGKMINDGKTFKEVAAYLETVIPKMRGFAYMSTLKYAKASGRISILSAVVGEALGLKPVLKVYNGSVDVVNKTRGEKAAISKLIESVKEEAENIGNQEIILVHGSNDPKIVEKVKCEIEEKLQPKSVYIGKLGCSITNNAGPQALGILFIGK